MKNRKPKQKRKIEYAYLPVIAKGLTPVFQTLYYVSLAGILLAAIIALIVLLVNTGVEEMLLPPYMTLQGGTYSIVIGSGIRMEVAADAITLTDIKTVIWAELLMAGGALCLLAPVSLFLSKLFGNVAEKNPLHIRNARYVRCIGLSVLVGETVLKLVSRFYNYLLVRTFSPDEEAVRLALGLDWGGILFGLLIISIGYILGYASVSAKAGENSETKDLTVTEE